MSPRCPLFKSSPLSLSLSLSLSPPAVTLCEVLPKDKKSKEEKTAELGHLTFDLLPLVCGERIIQLSSALQRAGEGGGGGEGEVDIEVNTSQELLSEEQLTERSLNLSLSAYIHTVL